MELILIKQDTPEWEYMWEWLASHPLNEGIENPSLAVNNGEAWQYMGSYKQDKRVLHTFRHRQHPKYNKVENVSVSASKELTEEQIAKNFKL
jgi:hypothetical protein